MSSDSAKENASVVDSSVSEWKQDIGNSDDPGGVMFVLLLQIYHVNLWGCHYLLCVICLVLTIVLL